MAPSASKSSKSKSVEPMLDGEAGKKDAVASGNFWSVFRICSILGVAVGLSVLKSGFVVTFVPGDENATSYSDIFSGVRGNDQHSAYDADVARSFYNLANEFYEYGWGDSFHFGFRRKTEPHRVSISNSQNFVAQKLQVRDMDRVVDMAAATAGPCGESSVPRVPTSQA